MDILALVLCCAFFMVSLYIDSNLTTEIQKLKKSTEGDDSYVRKELSNMSYRITELQQTVEFSKQLPVIEEYVRLKYPNLTIKINRSGETVFLVENQLASVEHFQVYEIERKLTELKQIIDTVCCKKGKK